MTILQELTSLRGEGRLTYSQEDSPVSRFQSQDNEKDRRMTVTSGRKCSVLYERYDPLGSLVRTLLGSSAWYNPAVRLRWKVKPLFSTRLTRKRYSSKNTLSRPSAEILSVRDIPSSRFLFQLAVSEPRTGGTGYGSSLAKLWKTPVTSDASDRRFYTNSRGEPNLSAQAKIGLPVSGKNWEKLLPTVHTQELKVCDKNGKTKFMDVSLLPTPTAQDFKRRGPNSKQQGLPEAACKKMLPTPTARSYKHGSKITDGRSRRKISQGWTMELNDLAVSGLLPTPTMRDYQPSVSPAGLVRKNGRRRDDALCNIPVMIGQHCQQNDGKTSQLNPLFVEEMMGYPLMWTTLPFLSQNGDKSQ